MQNSLNGINDEVPKEPLKIKPKYKSEDLFRIINFQLYKLHYLLINNLSVRYEISFILVQNNMTFRLVQCFR